MSNLNITPNGYNPESIHNENTHDGANGEFINVDLEQPKSKRRKHIQHTDANNSYQEDSTPSFKNQKHRLLGIFLILVASFLFVASISHLNSGIEDQSIVINSVDITDQNSSNSTQNIAGPLGALIGNFAIAQWFGISAFILILYLVIIGCRIFFSKNLNFWSLTFKCLILSLALSIVLGFITYKSENPLFLGGQHGYQVNDLLLTTTGLFGTLLVNIFVVITVVFIYLKEFYTFYTTYKNRVKPHLNNQKKESTNEIENHIINNDNEVKSPINEIVIEHPNNISDNTKIKEVQKTEKEKVRDSNKSSIIEINPEESSSSNTNDEVSLNISTSTIEIADEIISNTYDPTAELSRYRFPTLDLLINRIVKENSVDQQEQEENKERITKTLRDYTIEISHIEATVGPTVTLYEIIPAEGVRIAKIKRLEDDIALSLAALGIRIIAPIPGKGTIGIEVPNKDPQTVSYRSIIASKKFQECKYELPMAMGATISNDVFIADLTKMPHLLVAGATGQGKSVGLNAIIASLLYKKHPAELKFVLIDPKMVEFSLYSKLERHYLAKLPDEEEAIITDPSKVVTTLNSLCIEMDNRYNLLREANVRSILEYNAKFINKKLNPEKGHKYLPYIVMIVDEFADLIMTAGKEVETPIARIAQKARAVGMHMIIATQRPSTNVITGIIKANFPGRIAFRVSQMVDSKTILDRTGANQLIGRGDMLFSHNGDMQRVQCAFIDTPEVEAICNHIDNQIGYDHAYYLPEYFPDASENIVSGSITDRDPLFEEAARFIITSQTASTSSLQRRYSIGYNRAGKIMDQMEAAGIVGPSQGGKPRQVLIDSIQLERIIETFN